MSILEYTAVTEKQRASSTELKRLGKKKLFIVSLSFKIKEDKNGRAAYLKHR